MTESAEAAQRARAEATFELLELGREMMRNTLRRRHPEADEEEIDGLFREWMASSPHPSEGTLNIRRVSPEKRFGIKIDQ